MTTRLSQEQRLRLAKETEWRQNYAHYGVHPGNLGIDRYDRIPSRDISNVNRIVLHSRLAVKIGEVY
jgi:hypothetical protein